MHIDPNERDDDDEFFDDVAEEDLPWPTEVGPFDPIPGEANDGSLR